MELELSYMADGSYGKQAQRPCVGLRKKENVEDWSIGASITSLRFLNMEGTQLICFKKHLSLGRPAAHAGC